VAVAVTVIEVRLQILARNVGRPVRWTVTVICGFLGSAKLQAIVKTAAVTPAT
jgi:hypothetical protein